MNTTTIEMIPCDSSQIEAFGYDAESQILAIRFPGRGATPGSVYHYADVPANVFEAMSGAESKGKFFGGQIRGHYAYEKQPDANGVVFGLTTKQEPKYTTATKDGRLVNRATGKAIPDDEPVFVLRAQDALALPALEAYAALVSDHTHAHAVEQRIDAFIKFADAHPERTKLPDTAAA
ncbi:KTSC domain-containing protein [Methyloversatilis sp. XJ19-49]|uniref:KTSC domain-containing protein n=1 Tax=Methyloversatilis sp. XJ19-49 TaxID=2963429 RepID=UPI00211C6E54|nr:KTSC domain-containing protein [Methyloversatilis sp. XJ19-49]MCQ9378838.1 KTSC domain-containing protein [Methyloversatilis sp. XJ19-49]